MLEDDESRNVSKENPLRPGSVIIARNPGKKGVPAQFYLGKVIGVFWRSGAKHGNHGHKEKLFSTRELSAMDVQVFQPLTVRYIAILASLF
jgi:hypothetical protein